MLCRFLSRACNSIGVARLNSPASKRPLVMVFCATDDLEEEGEKESDPAETDIIKTNIMSGSKKVCSKATFGQKPVSVIVGYAAAGLRCWPVFGFRQAQDSQHGKMVGRVQVIERVGQGMVFKHLEVRADKHEVNRRRASFRVGL